MVSLNKNTVCIHKIIFEDQVIGFLIGNKGSHILTYVSPPELNYPSYSLAYKLPFQAKFRQQKQYRQLLNPILSNLLPEGEVRNRITDELAVNDQNELSILLALGSNLPGAIKVLPALLDEVPPGLVGKYLADKTIADSSNTISWKHSLAGVQFKMSVQEKDDCYILDDDKGLGNWIIKPPSETYLNIPLNEYTAMKLAQLAGVDIPDIKLIKTDKIRHLFSDAFPDEEYSFAIKRFDRNAGHRIHMEDFAQIFFEYPHRKYDAANYQQIGKVIYDYSQNKRSDIKQFARRLLVNILVGNGDAHLKNWSMIYPNGLDPILSPAYDIVTTLAYIENESGIALNLGKMKRWYDIRMSHFQYFATKIGIPWEEIKPDLLDTIDKARSLWPSALNQLPMNEGHKAKLRKHWKLLPHCFQI